MLGNSGILLELGLQSVVVVRGRRSSRHCLVGNLVRLLDNRPDLGGFQKQLIAQSAILHDRRHLATTELALERAEINNMGHQVLVRLTKLGKLLAERFLGLQGLVQLERYLVELALKSLNLLILGTVSFIDF